MSATKSPCAACKFLRRKCTQECVFAPYFPPDNPQKFANVHKVFGASNVAKLLNELNTSQREDAVNSLEYEAKAWFHDPVHGCVGLISVLQYRLNTIRIDLEEARKELAVYLGPQAMLPFLSPAGIMPQAGHHVGNPSPMQQQAMVPMMGIPTQQLVIRDIQTPTTHQHQQPQQQQFFENQAQLAAAMAARDAQYEMLRGYEQQHHHQQQIQQQQQQQQQEIARFNTGFDESGGGGGDSLTATGYNQIPAAGGMSPSLALGTFDDPYQIHEAKQENHGHGHSLQEQLLFQPSQQQQDHQQAQQQQTPQKSGSEEVKSVASLLKLSET